MNIGWPRQSLVKIAVTLLLAAALLWPVMIFGRPGYIMDSIAYYQGGEKAVAFVANHLPVLGAGPVDGARVAAAAADGDGVRAARSIPYCVAAFLLSAPAGSLLLLVLAQAVVTAYLIMIFLRASELARHRLASLLLLGVLVSGTALAPFVSLATPDVLAGSVILGIVALTLFREPLTVPERVLTTAAVAFALASHQSHVPLALGMVGLVMAMALWTGFRGGWRAVGAGTYWAAGVVALGVAAVVVTSFVGFGEVSIAPKRYPFALARSIEDGPARWYLEEHCRTEHYAVCELFPDGFPDNLTDFLWGGTGVARRASAAQMDRIRAEEIGIVAHATIQYAPEQAASSLANLRDQIMFVGLNPAAFQNQRISPEGQLVKTGPVVAMPWHIEIQRWVLFVSLAIILLLVWRTDRRARQAVFLVILSILGNDIICGVVSAPDIRYQNRILWLLPVMAALVWVSRRNAAHPAPSPVRLPDA